MIRLWLLFLVHAVFATLVAKAEGVLYFQCDKTYFAETGRRLQIDTSAVTISTVKFYIQHVSVSRHQKTIWQSPASHLIDLSEVDRIALSIPIDLQNGDSLFFTLGIDSVTCVAGVKSGDLDPTSGMYWTWRSGYINIKVEGTSSVSKARNQEFQYHLGGYEQPYPTVQEVYLQLVNANTPTIVFSLEDFFRHTDISLSDHIMTPGESAAKLSKAAAVSFYIK